MALAAWAPFARADADANFMAAREAFQKGRFDRLDALAAQLTDYPLYPYVAYWRMRARLPERSDADVQAFLAQYGDTLAGQRLRADWLKQLAMRHDWAAFNRESAGLVTDDVELACYRLQSRLVAGDASARTEARPLWFLGTAQPDSCTPVFDALMRSGQLTQEDVWARIRLSLEAGNVTFAKSLAVHLEPAQRIDPRQLDSATRNPQRYLDRMPPALKTRAQREVAMFATWRLAQTLPVVAATRLEKLDQQLSADERAYIWGQVALAGALRHRPEALDWYKRAGANLSDRQLGWKARSALRAGDWATVATAIESISDRERTLPLWRYWKARALLAQGNTADANVLLAPLSLEHNFYGQLAAEELGTSISSVPTLYHPTAEEAAAVEQTPGIQRALKFYQLGLRYEGTLEWRWTIRGFDDRKLLAAADVAQRAAWYDRAIDTADRTEQLHDFTLRFPTPYREVVSNYTRQLALDEAWVYGLVRQESRFAVDARSGAGAQGLMQIMPGTARHVARQLGLPRFQKRQAVSIDTNISLGTYYLRDLLDSLGNQTLLATAGYNAGPSRARAWRADKALEGAVYAETIPFNETRDYVRKVMNNTMYYSRLIGQQVVSLKQRLGTVPPHPLDNE